MISSKTLKIATAATALLSAHFAYSVSLQDLTQGYDVFVKDTAKIGGAHVEGSIAVGGNLELTGNQTEFGRRPLDSDFTVLAGSVTLNSNGKFAGGSLSPYKIRVEQLSGTQSVQAYDNNNKQKLVDSNVSHPGVLDAEGYGPISTGSVGLSFGNVFSALETASEGLRSLTPTTTLDSFVSGNNLSFVFGAGPLNKVVSIAGGDLSGLSNIGATGVAAAGETIVINVDLTGFGNSEFIASGTNLNLGGYYSNLIWNFYSDNAPNDSLNINGYFGGSILAPTLKLTHLGSGNIDGTIVAAAFEKTGNGELHQSKYIGDFGHQVPDSGSTVFLFLLSIPAFVALRRRMK